MEKLCVFLKEKTKVKNVIKTHTLFKICCFCKIHAEINNKSHQKILILIKNTKNILSK